MEITLITNGTVIPGKSLLKSLQNPKVTVKISDYGELSKKEELITLLRSSKIKYELTLQKWYELSAFHKEPLMGTELYHVVAGCCKAGGNGSAYLSDGKLFRCPIQGNLHRLGIFESDRADYVDLRQSDKIKLQNEISEFITVKEMVRITKL